MWSCSGAGPCGRAERVSRRGIGARSRLSAGRDAEEENEDKAEGSGWVRRANGAVACI